MWRIAVQFLLLHNISTNGCRTNCPTYHYKPHSIRAEFLKLLPDERNMTDIALIGTHLSAIESHQSLNISDQLKYGVRVFDFTVTATSNKFTVHDNFHFANHKFDHILNFFDRFLADNPKEFLIILMNRAHTIPWNVTKNTCQILDDYMRSNMLKKWSLNATIDEYRGKILLATINDWSFGDCVVELRSRCRVSSKYQINSDEYEGWNYGLEDLKAVEFTRLQDASFFENCKCFINIIASSSRRESISHRVALEGVGGLYCSMPMNLRVANTFANPHRALIIVLADFPTQELIDQINDSNNHNYSRDYWDVDDNYDPKVDVVNYMLKTY